MTRATKLVIVLVAVILLLAACSNDAEIPTNQDIVANTEFIELPHPDGGTLDCIKYQQEVQNGEEYSYVLIDIDCDWSRDSGFDTGTQPEPEIIVNN